jgi:photosystem II stability/assembly factor-like uncharacterized protein
MISEIMELIKISTIIFGGIMTLTCNSSPLSSNQSVNRNVSQNIFFEGNSKVTENPQNLKLSLSNDWRENEVIIERGQKISKIYFLDAENGWAYGENKIFRTSDFGKSWVSYPFEIRKNTEVVSLLFTNNSEGWIVLEKSDSEDFSQNDEVLIYRSVDGGKTWNLSHSEQSASDAYIYANGKNLWITARRFIGYQPKRLVPIIINFEEAKGGWTDVSESLKGINYDSRYIEGSYPLIRALAFRENNCVLIVNQVGKIFESCDNCDKWSYIKTLKSADDVSNSIRDIEFNDNYGWILDSSGGFYHGGSTLITIFSSNLDSISHTISLSDYFSGQGFSISPEEFYLTAQKFAIKDKKPKYKGIIIHTQDSGKSWEQIFKSDNAISLAQFFNSKNKVFWILTDKGTLHQLTQK